MTYLTGWLVTVFNCARMLAWSISNLSSTSTTPSLVTITVVLPGTKSLRMTNMSSRSFSMVSLEGCVPELRVHVGTNQERQKRDDEA